MKFKNIFITLLFVYSLGQHAEAGRLYNAVMSGDFAKVKSVLAMRYHSVNERQDLGSPLLHIAVWHHRVKDVWLNYVKVVAVLCLAPGINLKLRGDWPSQWTCGWTALHLAAWYGYPEIVETLCRAGGTDLVDALVEAPQDRSSCLSQLGTANMYSGGRSPETSYLLRLPRGGHGFTALDLVKRKIEEISNTEKECEKRDEKLKRFLQVRDIFFRGVGCNMQDEQWLEEEENERLIFVVQLCNSDTSPFGDALPQLRMQAGGVVDSVVGMGLRDKWFSQ